MSKPVKLLLCGLLPLAAGAVFSVLLPTVPMPALVLLVVESALLVLWGYFGYRIAVPELPAALQALLLCGVGHLLLALAIYQELGLGAFWSNGVGMVTQLYFLPLLTLSAVGVNRFLPVGTDAALWPCFVVIWVALLLAAWVGVRLRTKRVKTAD